MESGIFTLDGASVKSALVSVCLTIAIAMAGYVMGVGDVFKVEWHALVNTGVMAGLVGFVSLAKSYLSDNQGRFMGKIQIQ